MLKDRKLAVQKLNEISGWRSNWFAYILLYVPNTGKNKSECLLQQQNIELEEQRDHEKAMAELQQTQIQLIQKEKWFPLGELTAGIAHEMFH